MTTSRFGALAIVWLAVIGLACTEPEETSGFQTDVLAFDAGTYQSLRSEVLDENRTIVVHLPDDYATSNKRYPVLCVLDAEGTARFRQSIAAISFYSSVRRLPKMIVIGVVNTDRTRDLTPSKIEDRPGSGGGGAFLDFIESELIPYVEGRYRTASYRVLFGGSSAATFALYALFDRPEIFNACIASRPALNSVAGYTWDSDVIFRKLQALLAKTRSLNRVLYTDYGGQEDALHDPAPILGLSAIFEKEAPDDFRWKTVEIGESGYRSAESLANGLLAIFGGWYCPLDVIFADGIVAGEKHVEQLSRHFGYTVGLADLLPEPGLNVLGHRFLGDKRVEEAIRCFRISVDAHPDSCISHDGMAEAFMMNGDFDRAKQHIQRSLQLNPDNANAVEMLKEIQRTRGTRNVG